ncbi:MAG TPA: Stk1 family PASTA domain-containing Ser/Thr kinase [Actinomycetota bacterium]|nr:Stk1 family PASTA domain-containing Ser/Thr kinase [Actinomycetota bacterium]
MPQRPTDGRDLAFALRTLDGRYHVVDRIAAGGMGEVFRAHDAVLDRPVAIKVLHRQLASDRGFVDRFRREARAAAGLSHPNIVNVHDWGAVDGIYYMVMEFVRGTSARDVLMEQGVLAPAQATDVLLQTLSALEHAHRQGIVHRDIKPENVMITRDGVVKVADFGLARAYADAQITEAGTVTGTVQYLSPEQLQGEPADPRTDLYALGVVAYELLTGRLPFTGETPMAIAYKHLHEKVPPPSSRNPAVPRSLDGWVASMTEKQRELRPESAAEARRDLATEARSLPSAPDLATVVPDVAVIPAPAFDDDDDESGRATTVTIARVRTKKDKRRHRLRWGLGLLTTLAVVAGGAYAAWYYLLPKDTLVPDVVGLTTREAERQLEDAGLVVRIAKGRYSPTVVDGVVLSVSPRADTRLTEGDRVVIVPSLGHAPVEVPDLIGATLGKAKTLLRAADLRPGKVSHAYSATFDQGQVMRQSVAPEEEAPFQSEVRLVVSDGPAPVPVPDVTGKPAGAATSALEGAGFAVQVVEEHSDDVPAGKVIAQDPADDRDLQPGETVSIVVSLGPPTFPVPNVVGMTQGAAVSELQDLGLAVEVIELPGATGDLTVASQLPIGGNVVRVGTTITIYVA